MAIMNAETFVKLLEELIDLKIQRQAEVNLKPRPEMARLVQEKRHAD